jgi:hypothetical protein
VILVPLFTGAGIRFAGTGLVGQYALCKQIAKSGIASLRCLSGISLGARVADTVSEAAVGVEAPITIRADDRAMQDVIFEPGRAVASISP